MAPKMTVADLQAMKGRGEKICAGICYDYQMAQILEAGGAHLITVGDSVGPRFLGHSTDYEITLDEMVLFCRAVSQGVKRAVINCDLPFGPVQLGVHEAVAAAVRLMKEGLADMVKVDNSADNFDAVVAIASVGIPVFAQFGFSPQAMMGRGGLQRPSEEHLAEVADELIDLAQRLEAAGASALDVTNVNASLYGRISSSVSLPVLGGAATKEADGKIMGFSYFVPPDGIENAQPQSFGQQLALHVLSQVRTGFGEVRGWGTGG